MSMKEITDMIYILLFTISFSIKSNLPKNLIVGGGL